jgi:hypothetical protein
MMFMISEKEMENNTDRKIVADGKTGYKSIFELEGQFANDGHAQGTKFSMEQRMKTMGY